MRPPRLVVRASPPRRNETSPELGHLVGGAAASVVVAAAPAGVDGSVMSTEVVVAVVAAAAGVAVVVVVQCRRLRRQYRRSLPNGWEAACLRSCSPHSRSPVVHVLVPVLEP